MSFVIIRGFVLAPVDGKIKVELVDIPANEWIAGLNGGRRMVYINVKRYAEYWLKKFDEMRGATIDIKCKWRYYHSGGRRGVAFDFCDLNITGEKTIL
jgi:hypothetical protein